MKKRKESRHIYDAAITIDNIYEMWNIIRRTCKNKKAVFYFSLNLSTNIDYIYYQLQNRKYVPQKYHTFIIFEPKARLVMSQTIADKIINHFVANYYLIPYIERCLIDANVATRKNMGSKAAMNLLKKYLNKILINNKNQEIYCLKIDISKYFYSIDHEILLSKLEKKIQDREVLNIIKIIISETNRDYINRDIRIYNDRYGVGIPLYNENKGLSIGAMTSQFLAIFYLNDLDHFIKEKLRHKYYIRYMDDILILDTDKSRLLRDWQVINEEIRKLKLKTNSKSNIYRVSKGFTFLGYKYKVINNKLNICCCKKTFYRIKRKLRKIYSHDKVKYVRTFASYYGYLKTVTGLEGIDFKMKSKDRYLAYKEKYKNSLVIVKEGIFYKSFFDDGKILWYLFDYKYVNDNTSFGNTPYDKVIDKLRKLDISFIVVDNEKELLTSFNDADVYNSYLTLAIKSYDKFLMKNEILDKVNKVLDNRQDCYEVISSFLDDLLKDR